MTSPKYHQRKMPPTAIGPKDRVQLMNERAILRLRHADPRIWPDEIKHVEDTHDKNEDRQRRKPFRLSLKVLFQQNEKRKPEVEKYQDGADITPNSGRRTKNHVASSGTLPDQMMRYWAKLKYAQTITKVSISLP